MVLIRRVGNILFRGGRAEKFRQGSSLCSFSSVWLLLLIQIILKIRYKNMTKIKSRTKNIKFFRKENVNLIKKNGSINL